MRKEEELSSEHELSFEESGVEKKKISQHEHFFRAPVQGDKMRNTLATLNIERKNADVMSMSQSHCISRGMNILLWVPRRGSKD